VWTIKASLGGGATTLGAGTAISGGGTPDTGCGTPFRPVPAEFNHWVHVSMSYWRLTAIHCEVKTAYISMHCAPPNQIIAGAMPPSPTIPHKIEYFYSLVIIIVLIN